MCSCVVNASTSNSPDDYSCLIDLLKRGADPNYDNVETLERTGGYPLHLAIKLNVPRAVEILLARGASLVEKHEDKTALHHAFECNADECIAIICSHIAAMEEER